MSAPKPTENTQTGSTGTSKQTDIRDYTTPITAHKPDPDILVDRVTTTANTQSKVTDYFQKKEKD
ncbi:hypothetical protein AAVH_20870 [Aphelenchoides avenae]|nr:hypothetical protein AAVH_20870 [Aphelenchus avenae]